MNILVTGVGGDIGQGILKCLRDSFKDASLIGCDIDKYAGGRSMVDAFEVAPPARDEVNYLSFMEQMAKKYEVKYIYPATEVEIGWFDEHRHYLDDVAILINNKFIVGIFSDKYKTVRYLEQLGLLCPKTFLIEEYDGQLGYPFLIKQRRGSGGRGLIEVRDSDDFEFYRKRVSNAIVQEKVGTVDEEYTVGVFSDGKEDYSICFRRYLGYDNLSKLVVLADCGETEKMARTIVKSCKLEGCLNVQLRKTDRGYVPFEVNPRISSACYFRHCFGFQDVKWWLDLKEGKPINYEPKYSKGIGVRTIGEVLFECEA